MYPETLTTNDKANKLKIKSIYLELNMTLRRLKVHAFSLSNVYWSFSSTGDSQPQNY